MYKVKRSGSDMTITQFIPLDFPDLDRGDEDDEANKTAALVWHGFLAGRFGMDQELGIARNPELIWREPVDLSVLEPAKPTTETQA
jgi:hypothetical protein